LNQSDFNLKDSKVTDNKIVNSDKKSDKRSDKKSEETKDNIKKVKKSGWNI